VLQVRMALAGLRRWLGWEHGPSLPSLPAGVERCCSHVRMSPARESGSTLSMHLCQRHMMQITRTSAIGAVLHEM